MSAATPPPGFVHGSQMAYGKFRCACDVCKTAHRRRCKSYRARSIAAGGSTMVDAAPTAAILAAAAERMSLSAIGRQLGTSHSWVAKVIRGDIQRVSPARAAKVAREIPSHTPTDTSHVAALGTVRRLQALHAVGYTWPRLSAETGISLTGVKSIVYGKWSVIEAGTAARIRDAYERLAMHVPTADTPHQRGAITAARISSQKKGWPPPLAWDDIDEPNEQPDGWQYQPPSRAEVLVELLERGAGISEACTVLHVSRAALQKWCGNHQMHHVYRDLASREVRASNQYDNLAREAS